MQVCSKADLWRNAALLALTALGLLASLVLWMHLALACVRGPDSPRALRCLVAAGMCATLAGLCCIHHVLGSYEAHAAELDSRFGVLLQGPADAAHTAPLWVGEFGTSDDSAWWQHTLRYLGERDLDWAYWSVNGQRGVNQTEVFSLLQDDSATVRHPWKLQGLQDLMSRMRR